ncbi:MAG: CotH kinase family protein [Bacteroidales bacterium]|nr:CotH kinase family protein [Bacteroidales bacterium]
MKKKFANIVALAITFTASQASQAGVVINELMPSNISNLMVNQDFPDSWVELYNPTDEVIDISGWYIAVSDTWTPYEYYQLPTVAVPAKGYRLLYCDKEGSSLHACFRIDSGKETLYLYDSEQNLVDKVERKKQPCPNAAYGRESDGDSKWGWELTPTPGAANGGGFSSDVLPEPLFSIPGSACCSEPFTLTLTLPSSKIPADTRIYYTLDGSEPSLASDNGLEIELEIDSSTVVRATLISAEALSPLPTTHTYIFGDRGEMPVVCLSLPEEFLYDEEIGLFWWDGVMYSYSLWNDQRRPLNYEIFLDPKAESLVNQVGEMGVHGGWTRSYDQKSVKLKANKRFGTKRIYGKLWEEKDVDENKTLVLRNGGNDFLSTHMVDAFLQTLFGTHCQNFDWQAYRPCMVYINGKYYGLMDMRECTNEDYVYANYDGLEDIYMVDEWKEIKVNEEKDRYDAWNANLDFVTLYTNPESTYEQMEEAVDVDAFINYLAFEWFGNNVDYPLYNIVQWRPAEAGG